MKGKLILLLSSFGLAAIVFFMIQYQIDKEKVWKSWNLALSGQVIIVDAGHGGPDGGAVGKGDILEKDIALSVAIALRDYLQQAGALVIMTREEDDDLADDSIKNYRTRWKTDLRNRVEILNNSDANMFVSIHLNASNSPSWSGAQTFYHPRIKESEIMSKFIQAEIKRNLENTNRYAAGIQNIYLLKHAEIPGSLIEIGFLSNGHEKELLMTEEYQRKMAASIYEGILRYYSNEKPPEK